MTQQTAKQNLEELQTVLGKKIAEGATQKELQPLLDDIKILKVIKESKMPIVEIKIKETIIESMQNKSNKNKICLKCGTSHNRRSSYCKKKCYDMAWLDRHPGYGKI